MRESRLLGTLARAAALGALMGPVIGAFFVWINDSPWDVVTTVPIAWLGRSLAIGALYGVAFVSFSAIPVGFARRRRVHPVGIACLGGGGALVALEVTSFVLHSPPAQISPRTLVGGVAVMSLIYMNSERLRLKGEWNVAVMRAQVRTLQSQINPHFFFNTLNTISALIPDNPESAQRTIGRMADISRYAFAAADSDVVPLSQELEFTRQYLEIEALRFGKRLRIELPEAADVEGVEAPPLILQPLVENAIRHGIAKRLEGGTVSVRLHRMDRRFFVTVENESAETPAFKPGHALDNIRERLRLIYSGRASIRLSSPQPGLVGVTIEAPIRR